MKPKIIALVIDVEQFIPAKNQKSRLDSVRAPLLDLCSHMMDDDCLLLAGADIQPRYGSGPSLSAISQYTTPRLQYAYSLRTLVDLVLGGFDYENDDVHFFVITDKYESRYDSVCAEAMRHWHAVNVTGRTSQWHFWSIGKSFPDTVDARVFEDASDIDAVDLIGAIFG